MDDKEILQQLKTELQLSGKSVISSGKALSTAINQLKFNEKLYQFNAFITGLNKKTNEFQYHAKHKHLLALITWLDRNISKMIKQDEREILDKYLSDLKEHIKVHNQYINSKIKNNKDVESLDDTIIMKRYTVYFANDEKAKESRKEVEEAKKNELLKKKNGVPTLFKITDKEKDAKSGELKSTKTITANDLNFSHFTRKFEFSNGIVYIIDVYPSGIYMRHNLTPDGKFTKSVKFNGAVEDLSSIEVIEDNIDEEQTNNKENEDDIKE
ncbi:hypothetical protein K3Z84_00605 [Pseudomonas aeruginosa]|nr:hypothetical protein [Pseudomonas aeruginosa]